MGCLEGLVWRGKSGSEGDALGSRMGRAGIGWGRLVSEGWAETELARSVRWGRAVWGEASRGGLDGCVGAGGSWEGAASRVGQRSEGCGLSGRLGMGGVRIGRDSHVGKDRERGGESG